MPLEEGVKFCACCGARVAADKPAPPSADEDGRESMDAPADTVMPSDFAPPTVPLHVEVAMPDAMFAGEYSPIVFRLGATEDSFQSIELELRKGDVLVERGAVKGLPGLDRHTIAMNIMPSAPGMLLLELAVKCRRFGAAAEEIYLAALTVVIKGGEKGVINIVANGPQISASGNASDHRVNVGGNVFNIPSPKSDVVRDPTALKVFKPLELRLKATAPELTLLGEGEAIQLYSKHEVVFGRSLDCDCSIRCFESDGAYSHDKSCRISRRHLKFSSDGGTCLIEDAGSKGGTLFDGVKLEANTPKTVKSGVRHEIVFAGVLNIHATVFDTAYGIPGGIAIGRGDCINQHVFIVFEPGIPIGGDGERIYWDGFRFVLQKGKSRALPLAPGMSVSIAGRTFQVVPYRHTFIG